MNESIRKRISESFIKQGFMETLGASLISIEEGKVIIQCPFDPKLSQQNGFFHAGVLTSIVDSACGYAAYTVMPDQSDVLSVEFKINFLKPANANLIYAIGNVIQVGKTLVICEGMVTNDKQDKVFAKMIATLMTINK
ncbi:MAG: PaaI family thioesterase [Saprospiraceae bacterium]